MDKCSLCKNIIYTNNEELCCFYDIHHNILCYNCCKSIIIKNENALVINRKKQCIKHFFEEDGYGEASCIHCGTVVCVDNDIDELNY